MTPPVNARVLALLDDAATLLELGGANQFKVRAYRNAVRTLRGLDQDLGEMARAGTLRDLPGIGAALADNIAEIAATGKLTLLEELGAKLPRGLAELSRIPGLGPKKAAELCEKLGVSSVGELEQACNENRLLGLKGFGARTQEKVLAGIALLRRDLGRFRYDRALEAAEPLLATLRSHPAVTRAEAAGSLRRRMETVADLDLVAAVADPDQREAVLELAASLAGSAGEVIARGPTKTSVRLATGLQVDVRAVAGEELPFALQYFTGSKEHNVQLRGRAIRLGLKLNEYGLFAEDGSRVPAASEDDVYRALGLPPIPPELREGQGEIEAALEGRLPALVETADLRGAIHNHTDQSDGLHTLREMVDAAQALGWEYIGISDHSPAAFYAKGLEPERVRAQQEAIEAINAEPGRRIRVLKGSEADILADGSIDHEPAVRASFEFVVASIHSRHGMDRDAMTARVLRGLDDPAVMVLGHPTGRLLLARDPYGIDLEAVIDKCAAQGVALEVNADPRRMDADWRWLKRGKERGLKVMINPDAHRTQALANVAFGVGLARKGWLEKDDVVNTRDLAGLRDFFAERRRRAAAAAAAAPGSR